ncbi:MAG: transcription-repair coupling factor [Deltaproteobacteria bacterium GWB2_55_19]|nr:MAG: transcription-repair coupling factor [Deltaproteobacteria bacterium GWB2_55_19]
MSEVPEKQYSLNDAVRVLGTLKRGGRLKLTGLHGSSKALLIASAFKRLGRPVFVIAGGEESAEEFTEDLRFFLPESSVIFYPSPEVLPFEPQPAHQEILSSRMEVLFNLLSSGPKVCVASAATLMQRVMPRDLLSKRIIVLKEGEEVQRDGLVQNLQELGYLRMSLVEERGEMSVRGGILDIFPPMYASPLRVEFFGDEIESIRGFDISTQRSLDGIKEARILPAKEAALPRDGRFEARERLMERADALQLKREAWEPISDKLREGSNLGGLYTLLPLLYPRLETVFDYLKDETLVALVEPDLVSSEIERFERDLKNAEERLKAGRQFFVPPHDLYLAPEEARASFGNRALLEIESIRGAGTVFPVESNLDLRQEMGLKKGTDELLKPLADRIGAWLMERKSVYISAHNKAQAERTRDLLSGYDLSPVVIKGADILAREDGGLCIAIGAICTGFRLPLDSIAVISEEEVFGERARRRAPPSRKLDAFLTELQDLSVGDFIVHAQHGIGLYRGLKRLAIDNIESDFLLLEYRGGDKLYLPVGRLDLVSKYHGVEGKSPDLDKLGGPGWEKAKRKVKASVERLAGELLKLYAERQVADGFAFSPPERLFQEFEASFEFDETPDQARAIEETLKDMEEPRPMDRLICGDVGYGKTEVAIRAAFKAVLDKKQVAVLVPTTVLAQQHFRTFSRRLAPYPVTVDVLSRFRSKKEQKEVVEGMKNGTVDILIGTHRLLQKDIEFKDLGLIVIDEEHRFGVAHKERLKSIRKKVDCMTLTATPIPRTLHMSLASIRELSIINTPPEDRLAIRTNVVRFDEEAIREAIERELNRGGQVFFVHNRIQSIGKIEEFLRKAVPEAKVAVAHGQMKEGELEKKMLGFINREYDILLSTAIIESGLDIPSANTIIINRADRFGLAELYQLRGRVGRSKHRAYAYFICPSIAELTDDARKRMEVIQELCEPGSGFKIATYDLEIRGAGELLGSAQSGQIAEVGFEMYTQLLEEAVRELKGEEIVEEVEPEINLKVSQYIPEEYMPDARQRLSFYKRLASVQSEYDITAIEEEMADRYGEVPALILNLMQIMSLKLPLKKVRAKELIQKGTRLYFAFQDLSGSDHGKAIVGKALSMASKEPTRYRLTPDGHFIVYMKETASPIEEARYVLKEFLKG